MPSKSGKQHRLMAMVANDPKAAKRLGIPQSVGKEYTKADKGKKFKEGGMAKQTKAGKSMPEAKDMGSLGLKKGGKCKGYKGGGVAEPDKPTPEQAKQMRQQVQDMRMDKANAEAYKKATGKKFARGGGVEVRGKTRGKII